MTGTRVSKQLRRSSAAKSREQTKTHFHGLIHDDSFHETRTDSDSRGLSKLREGLVCDDNVDASTTAVMRRARACIYLLTTKESGGREDIRG